MEEFKIQELARLYRPATNSSKEDNGQVTIIGGSGLFHGAPILALKTASRVVDMVFFSSPEPSLGKVAPHLKSQLSAFIWVPFNQVEEYIKKSGAVLIGPGLMRYRQEKHNSVCQKNRICDPLGEETKKLSEDLLQKFPYKQWVIDGGSLQVMEAKYIPKNAILTPNKKEYALLFGSNKPQQMAKKYNCIVVLKSVETIVCSPNKCVLIKGGNAGLTKGGTGDVLAGLTVGLAAKNPPFLGACAASFIVKKAADLLYNKVGFAYNADDLAEKIPEVLGESWK
jgi:NAD(P)H-hydrate epimerase